MDAAQVHVWSETWRLGVQTGDAHFQGWKSRASSTLCMPHDEITLVTQAERNVVEAMTQCKRPDMAGLQQLVTPVGTEIQAADKLTQVSIPPSRSAHCCQL